jgi:RNA polymerase sigma-70 factor (ECF subfamily)
VTEPGRGNAREDRDHPRPAPLTLEEETDLLERASRGDTRAYGRLVLAYQDLVYGHVRRSVQDPAVAEEITQDVFLKAFRSLSSFRGEAKFTTWLYRIAVNACRDERAHTARRRSRESPWGGGEEQMSAPAPQGPDAVLEETEVQRGFQAGLDALDEKHREAFLLRHEEGLSYEEVARVLGISTANAKVRVHRAREALLKALRDRGFDV